VGRNAVQTVVSYPIGALADRLGALPVLIGGYSLGVLTAGIAAVAFWFQSADIALWCAVFAAAGAYNAAQEALESAAAADIAGPERLATNLGALGTVNGVTKLIASSMVGIVWTTISPFVAFALAAVLMASGCVSLLQLRGRDLQ
jgi:MFS family permease